MATMGTLQVAAAIAFVIVSVVTAAKRQRLAAHQPATLALLGFTLLAIAVSPSPFPYNAVWMTPAVLLAAVAGAHALLARAGRWQPYVAAVLVACALAQLLWQANTDRYMKKTWHEQLALIAAAEVLTGADDPVFDGLGMVVTRPPASKDWIVHSLFMKEYQAGAREQLRDIIQRAAPPVIIRGHYRFQWLADADKAAVDAHYQALSSELWVLGQKTHAANETIKVLRAGRYLITGDTAAIDGVAVEPGAAVVTLTLGDHEVTSSAGARVLWVGPTLTAPPAVPTFHGSMFGRLSLPGQ